MKTPIDMQDDINCVIDEILNNWTCEDFDTVLKDYLEYIEKLKKIDTFSKRVDEFVKLNKYNNMKNDIIPKDYKEIVDAIRYLFDYLIRIGILQYSNLIDENFIDKEIENRKDELYFLNNSIKVEYTKNISHFK